jgi:hypothetical protein
MPASTYRMVWSNLKVIQPFSYQIQLKAWKLFFYVTHPFFKSIHVVIDHWSWDYLLWAMSFYKTQRYSIIRALFHWESKLNILSLSNEERFYRKYYHHHHYHYHHLFIIIQSRKHMLVISVFHGFLYIISLNYNTSLIGYCFFIVSIWLNVRIIIQWC